MLKSKKITIEDGGKQLSFEIRQMPATRLESWVLRAALVLARAGVECDEGAGIEELIGAIVANPTKVIGALQYDAARPLYDELLGCCYKIDGAMTTQVNTETADAYISDFKTLMRLRIEAFKINFDFFSTGARSGSQEERASVIRMG